MAVTQIIIEGGQGCECAPDRVVGQPPALQMIAPGEDVRPGHLPELVNTAEAGKGEELPDIPLNWLRVLQIPLTSCRICSNTIFQCV
jgi:hypothetical protein